MLNNETMEIKLTQAIQLSGRGYTTNCLYDSEINTHQYHGMPPACNMNICSLVDIYLVIVASI